MTDKKTVKEVIEELESEFAESIREAQARPGLRGMEIVYGGATPQSGSMPRRTTDDESQD